MRARAGGREYHGRAPSAAPVLSPAEEDESAGFSDGPVTTVSDEDPASDCEDATDSAGCADSPPVPAASSEVPASSVARVLSDCSASFIQRFRRLSRMRIDTSIGVPLNPKV